MVANLSVFHPPDLAALGLIDIADDPSLGTRLGHHLDDVFAEVVVAFEAAVFTTALRVCGRSEEAEDLTAETFLRAYAALRRYPAERIADLRLRPWLITICLNQWRNQVRTAARRPHLATSPPSVPAFPSTSSASSASSGPEPAAADESPEARAERHDEGDRLGAALQQLPAKQRIAVVLRHIVGLSYGELAEALACPEGTAKSHVSRGLDHLRILLADDQEVLP